jgi:alkanesulfonate monooxygenase SsuD/methylene tetrahydromethanopterin reductase-like flavin-dependent oxidoreductase (luciferase family)
MTAWITLTAIATRTRRISLGTMLTPLPEQLPWYVAAQTATLDQLSGGRVILTAGLGVLEQDTSGLLDTRVRARRLDEAVEILDSRWQGESLRTFLYEGHYSSLREMRSSVECICTCHSRNRVSPSGLLAAQSRVNSGAQLAGMAQ